MTSPVKVPSPLIRRNAELVDCSPHGLPPISPDWLPVGRTQSNGPGEMPGFRIAALLFPKEPHRPYPMGSFIYVNAGRARYGYDFLMLL